MNIIERPRTQQDDSPDQFELSDGLDLSRFRHEVREFCESRMPPAIRAKRQIREGINYVRHHREILLVMWVVGFVGMFGMNFQMTSALMAQQQFHRGPQEYGILGTLMAVGSLSGALIAARRRIAPRGRFVVLMASAFGLVEIVTGLMPNYWSYAAMLPVLGFVALMTLTASNATIQLGVDPRLRGRVMALYMMVFMGGTPAGAPVIGWLGEHFGARWTLIAGGLLVIAGTAFATLLFTRRKGIVVRPKLEPHPHMHVYGRREYAELRS